MEKIPLIEPVKERKEFGSVDEFNIFYNEHKDEFNTLTTCKLNKKYHVPGYRITKIKGVVSLKNIPESRITFQDKLEALNERMTNVETKVNTILKRMNEIIDTVNKTVTTLNTNIQQQAQAEQQRKEEQQRREDQARAHEQRIQEQARMQLPQVPQYAMNTLSMAAQEWLN